MPDLMSHLIIGLILAELFNVRKKSLVVLGALAPDILSKIQLVYLHFKLPAVISFVSMHTPVMFFLLSILIALLFKFDRVKAVILLNIGAMSHFLSDLTMKHFTILGTRLFYPFSNKNYTFNLIWPEQSIYILISSFFVYLIIIFVKMGRRENWSTVKSIFHSFKNFRN